MPEPPVNPIGCVIPRGGPAGSKINLPLDELIRPIVERTTRGIILLTAPPGGGKTTAIRHLRNVLPSDGSIVCFDTEDAIAAYSSVGLAVLAAVEPAVGFTYLEVFTISPWSIDDCLEYLLANHRDRCGAVLSRITTGELESSLGGSPEILAMLLDALAADPSITCGRDALRRLVRRVMPAGKPMQELIEGMPFHQRLNPEQHRLWRHEPVRRMCVVGWIVEQLCEKRLPDRLFHMKSAGDWIDEIAADARHRPEAVAFLRATFETERRSAAAPVVASLLLAIDGAWRPGEGSGTNLAGARLAGARWAGVDLTGADLRGTDLSGADLASAILVEANADRADLSGALLWSARMYRVQMDGANLLAADLSNASAKEADFSNADLRSAIAQLAKFQGTKFEKTDFSQADCAGIDCSGARFVSNNFADADFSGARFFQTKFHNAEMSDAGWTGADFERAKLINCNLEGLDLPNADFAGADLTGSLLTGSRMPGANFHGANLTATGLADIDWEGADLGGADLAKASFHLGSTRSGLVGSVIAGEGSRTGFYTDDFNDQLYRPPEEIRKANLCRANLIDAKTEGTDFYLVDLRKAAYSKQQAAHFARTGAILRGNES